MKTKIRVFNDLKVPMRLQVQNITGDAYVRIPEGRFSDVEIEIPDDCILFIKIWATGQALLSYHLPSMPAVAPV